jgi:hypothetical protein
LIFTKTGGFVKQLPVFGAQGFPAIPAQVALDNDNIYLTVSSILNNYSELGFDVFDKGGSPVFSYFYARDGNSPDTQPIFTEGIAADDVNLYFPDDNSNVIGPIGVFSKRGIFVKKISDMSIITGSSPSLAVYENRIYAADNGGVVYVYDKYSGNFLFQFGGEQDSEPGHISVVSGIAVN